MESLATQDNGGAIVDDNDEKAAAPTAQDEPNAEKKEKKKKSPLLEAVLGPLGYLYRDRYKLDIRVEVRFKHDDESDKIFLLILEKRCPVKLFWS